MVRRGRKLFVVCSASTRHKQRQGMSTLARPDGVAPAGSAGLQKPTGPLSFTALPYLGTLLTPLGDGEDDL